jgi:uncharacterized membrane protein
MIGFLLLILVLIAISARIKTNRKIEVYKLALEKAVAYHNYVGYINSSIGFKRHYEKNAEEFIEDARLEIKNDRI